MLPTIRKIVYKMGLRPKLGSIFYSPSFTDHKKWSNDNAALLRVMAQNKAAQLQFDEGIANLPSPIIFLGGEGFRMKPLKEAQRVHLYDRMTYCVFCGGRLRPFVADVKECPQNCGRAFLGDDSMGLPVITVEPIGD